MMITSTLSYKCGTYDRFQGWKIEYKKSYSYLEEKNRYNIFKENDCKIEEYNLKRKKGHHFLALNQYADLTPEEFKRKKTKIIKQININQPRSLLNMVHYKYLPLEVDWRKRGVVTPVKNQEQCGSCWAFSTTGSIEGLIALKQNKTAIPLSEQQLVDCVAENDGCQGGSMSIAMNYVSKHGITTEKNYPYNAKKGICKTNLINQYKIKGFRKVRQNNPLSLKSILSRNPVSVAIEADSHIFQFYHSGIIRYGSGCGTNLDHGVLLVGYGVDKNGISYWIGKNSWSSVWGEKGYFRLERRDNTSDAGVCGVQIQPVYPI